MDLYCTIEVAFQITGKNLFTKSFGQTIEPFWQLDQNITAYTAKWNKFDQRSECQNIFESIDKTLDIFLYISNVGKALKFWLKI